MENIYIDNIRGFSNIHIPIKDVNFLVGENSTGKTTVLSIIDLLSDYRFCVQPRLYTQHVDLGIYDEIVNQYSENKTYFQFGYYRDDFSNVRRLNYEKFYALLLKFKKSKEGLPVLDEFNYLSDTFNSSILIRKNRFKAEFIDEDFKNKYKPKDVFMKWIKQGPKVLKDYDKFKIKHIPFPNNMILEYKQLLESQFSKTNNRKIIRKELSIPVLLENFVWLAPLRSKPKRTYDLYRVGFSPEGEHIPYLLNSLYKIRNNKILKMLFNKFNMFGVSSGLFESIEPKIYGLDKNAPFSLNVITNGKPIKISNVGYGVSQSLPIITEMIFEKPNKWFAIQQPEVHLHPRAQAIIGEMIFDAYKNLGKKFIVETHSDFIIDRFRFNIKKSKKTTKDKICSQILFFERIKNGNTFHIIEIENSGKYSENQPKSFKEFFIKEELLNLGF